MDRCRTGLASLFWRLRRATSIGIWLLRMQSEILRAFRSSRPNAEKPSVGEGALSAFGGNRPEFRQDVISGAKGEQEFTNRAAESGDIAISFLRLANLDSEIVDRLSPRTNGPDVEVGIVTRCNDPASGVVLAGAATKAI